MERTYHAALKQAPEILDPIRMNIAANLFAARVGNYFELQAFFGQAAISAVLIGVDRGVQLHMVTDHAPHDGLYFVLDGERFYFRRNAFCSALQHACDRLLVIGRTLAALVIATAYGAIARTVADVRFATRVMAGGDPRDPWWVPAPFDGEPLRKPIRIAVTHNSHGYPMHPGITQLIDRAVGYLRDAGYEIVETEPPSIIEPARGWFSVLLTELKATLETTLNHSGSDEVRRIFGWYYEIGKLLDCADYRSGLADRTRMMRQWSVFLDEYPLVLTPFLMRPLYPWNYDAQGLEQTKDLFDASVYSYGINYLGLPAGVVPIDLVGGLPAGVQLVGRRFREDLILDAMATVEQGAGCLYKQLWARQPEKLSITGDSVHRPISHPKR